MKPGINDHSETCLVSHDVGSLEIVKAGVQNLVFFLFSFAFRFFTFQVFFSTLE